MSDELVSAFLDGECAGRDIDRLLTAFERDEALRSRFDRMQLARDATRGVAVGHFAAGFADRVMQAIGDEMPEATSLRVVPLHRRRPAWVPVAGFAAAASVVAAVTAGVLFGGSSSDGAPIAAPAPMAAPQSVAAAPAADTGSALPIVPVSSAASAPSAIPVLTRPPVELRWAQIEGEQARQLNNYLIDYSNYRSAQGVGGTLGYARFAAHTADYRPQGE